RTGGSFSGTRYGSSTIVCDVDCPAGGVAGPNDLRSVYAHDVLNIQPPDATPNKVYLGYAAQPFLSQVAERLKSDPPYLPNPPLNVPIDHAIELYNPYNVALSLEDYKLVVDGTEYDLSGKNLWIPPRDYFVLTAKNPAPDSYYARVQTNN